MRYAPHPGAVLKCWTTVFRVVAVIGVPNRTHPETDCCEVSISGHRRSREGDPQAIGHSASVVPIGPVARNTAGG